MKEYDRELLPEATISKMEIVQKECLVARPKEENKKEECGRDSSTTNYPELCRFIYRFFGRFGDIKKEILDKGKEQNMKIKRIREIYKQAKKPNKLYCKDTNGEIHEILISELDYYYNEREETIYFWRDGIGYVFSCEIASYGETWALTEDELKEEE